MFSFVYLVSSLTYTYLFKHKFCARHTWGLGTIDHVGSLVELALPLQLYFGMNECSECFQTIFNQFLAIQRSKKPFLLKNFSIKS